MPIICEPDEAVARRLAAGFREHGQVVSDLGVLAQALAADPEEFVVIIGPGVELAPVLAFAAAKRMECPALGVVLVRDRLAVDVLAEAMRAGVREVIADRDFPALMAASRRSWEISQQLRAAEQAARRPGSGGSGQVIVVFSAKGGCGKSMLSTNLAVALALGGRHRACLVDLDLPFGDVGIMLRVDPHHTIVDAVPMGEHMDQTGVRSMLVKHDSGLHAALAPVAPGDAEKVGAKLVTELLGVLRGMFDCVIVDTPSQFSEQVLAALDNADLHLLLASPEVTALKGLRVTLDMLDMLGYRPDGRAVILNRADTRAGLSAADIDRVVGRPIAAQIPTSADVPASINRGVPITMAEPQHPVSRAIRQVAQLVTDGAADPEAEPEEPRSGRRMSRRRARRS